MRKIFKAISRRRNAVTLVAMMLSLAAAPIRAQTPPELQRIPFQIATGPISGSYLPAGEALAVVISHPPGLGRCESARACGPEGLIATTRSSSGSVSNAISVDRGTVQSAIVQGDVAVAAKAGTGPFAETGALQNLRIIARLHDENLHFVVAARSRIKRLKDLAGRRVAIDSSNSATEVTVRQLLRAAGVPFASLALQRLSPEMATEDLEAGKLDAFFILGVAPIRSVDELMRHGYTHLIGIDSRTLQKLNRRSSMYRKTTLPSGTYRSSKSIAQLSVGSFWVVNRSQSSETVEKILQALWNPANQADLRNRTGFPKNIQLHLSPQNAPLPLHDGAKRFYASSGR